MLRALRRHPSSEGGFTLIELLVVILIIGILAATAIPSFLGQRFKAQDTGAKVAANSARTAMETYYTDNQTYVGVDATGTQLASIEPSLTEWTMAVTETTATTYKINVNSVRPGVKFAIRQTSLGVYVNTCEVPSSQKRGGCSANGSW